MPVADFNLEAALEPPPARKVKHLPGCRSGKLRFYWSWSLPFLRIYRSKSVCLCDVLRLLDEMHAGLDGLKEDTRG